MLYLKPVMFHKNITYMQYMESMKIIKVHIIYILISSAPWRALQGAKIREFLNSC